MKSDSFTEHIIFGIGFGIGYVILTELFAIIKTHITGKPPVPH